MIGEKERYHGVVLLRIVASSDNGVRLRALRGASRSCYSVDDSNAMMVKYSTNRLSPWQFVVAADQCSELVALSAKFKRVLIVLVCGNDGVAVLDWEVIKSALPAGSSSVGGFSLQAKRRRRERYRISGLWATDLVVPDATFADVWLP